ncbi:DUF2407 C-terminal domain-containing protein [Podospora appendiculata]|uniref:DUF2407 C-terminal domain-containing protein n=1 Tax=Podospora appendiculata TaxID=314037 RepID=A0AAE0X2C7_9PEZI|nr:DUF2407 C-terminal domain-containing protein [Podospora appendiculata]
MTGRSSGGSGGGGSSSRSPSSSSSSPTKPSQRLPLPSTSPATLAPPSSPSLSLPRSPSSPQLPPPPPPLHLTIRFSAALRDLQLDILHPQRMTVVALKHLIRARLAAADATPSTSTSTSASTSPARGRLRFIHSGKILPDAAALSSVLKPTPPPLPSSSTNFNASDPRSKGKGIEGRAAQRVYVNCSIGDPLTDAELAAEAAQASETPAAPAQNPQRPQRGRATGLHLDTTTSPHPQPQQLQPQQQRGFDRLLSTGFTPAEVNQLRLQFRSIQAQRHTPDTMPSPDSLRRMEDTWIDSNGAASVASGGDGMGSNGGGGEDGEGGDAGDAFGFNGVVDALIKGMFIGFVFPLGAIGWLLREEGIWSRRWQVFVSLGFFLSLGVGIVRGLTGEG